MNINFKIDDFEGPLDLLLHLVRTTEIDIAEINTTEIINQYLEFIHKAGELNIDIASEYLVMAAELVHLKSKILINEPEEENEESEFGINSEEDLKNKLLEYDRYKKLSEDFKLLEEKRSEVFTKLPESLKEYEDKEFKINYDVTVNDLLNAFLAFQERHKLDRPLKTRITRRELSVEERTTKIRDILKVKGKVNFMDLFEEYTRDYFVVTLLSILEMSKNNEVTLKQKKNFSPIMIESKVG